MFYWILVVINLNGGEPAQIFMENARICQDAAVQFSPHTTQSIGVCVYTGIADE